MFFRNKSLREHFDELTNLLVPLFLLGMFLILTSTFLIAYFNGGKAIITLNWFREGTIELIEIAIMWPLTLYWIWGYYH